MAALACVGSPFVSSASDAQRLPARKTTGKLLIRCEGSDGDYILVNIDPVHLVSATRAAFLVKHDEAIEICGYAFDDASDVSILAGSGTPSVYWGFA